MLDNGATADQVNWFVSKATQNIDDEFSKSAILVQISPYMSNSSATPDQVYQVGCGVMQMIDNKVLKQISIFEMKTHGWFKEIEIPKQTKLITLAKNNNQPVNKESVSQN